MTTKAFDPTRQQIIPAPDCENLPGRFYIQRQYSENGPIFTDTNEGQGFTEEQAHANLVPKQLTKELTK